MGEPQTESGGKETLTLAKVRAGRMPAPPVWLISLMLFLLLAAPLAAPAALAAEDDLPIFDAHLHYSADAWDAHPVDSILGYLDQAGVRRALVSSTPDDGTLRLYERTPGRIVPILRPYRTQRDMVTWTRDGSVLAYVEARLKQRVYKGIGEFHLRPGEADHAVPRAFAAIAAGQNIFLHCHCDAVSLAELLALRSDVRVLWAHAGMNAGPATVGRLLETQPNLWVELALRTDVAPGGTLDPRWSALFQGYPDRFMIGTDTWVASRWPRLPRLMADVQVWLKQLPRDVAERIAYREALFGA